MENEVIQPRTLLKAKDGSEYIEFKFYVIRKQAKSETPTDRFCGMTTYQDRVYRNVEDYRIADDAEQKIYKLLMERKTAAFREYREWQICSSNASEKARGLQNQLNFIAGIYTYIGCVLKKIDKMENYINAVITYTAKDYVKGDAIKKDLKDIREDLANLRKPAEQVYKSLTKDYPPEKVRLPF